MTQNRYSSQTLTAGRERKQSLQSHTQLRQSRILNKDVPCLTIQFLEVIPDENLLLENLDCYSHSKNGHQQTKHLSTPIDTKIL